jgi:hypothetical protein
MSEEKKAQFMNKIFCRMQIISIVLILVVSTPALRAQTAQPSPTLQEQLQAQYPLATITTRNGCTVANPDTASPLVIQKPGVIAVPAGSFAPKCEAKYENGKLNSPGLACTGKKTKWIDFANAVPGLKNQVDKINQVPERAVTDLEKGDNVYLTRIEVSKNAVKLTIGYCSGEGTQAASYKGTVVFRFKDNILKSGSITQVEDAMNEVFSQGGGNEQAQSDSGSRSTDSDSKTSQPEQTMPPRH